MPNVYVDNNISNRLGLLVIQINEILIYLANPM